MSATVWPKSFRLHSRNYFPNRKKKTVKKKKGFTAFGKHIMNSVGMLLIKQLLLLVSRVKSTEVHRRSVIMEKFVLNGLNFLRARKSNPYCFY